MEPTPPSPVLVASRWADEGCSFRPSQDTDWPILYLRIEEPGPFNIGPGVIGETYYRLEWNTDPLNSMYGEFFYAVDWYHEFFTVPLSKGQVIPLENPYPELLPPEAPFDFYL